MRNRFVVPSVTTLTLSDGAWIQVKDRLNVGEERAAFQKIVGEVNAEGWRRPNVETIGLAECEAYLVGWSFLDPEGHPVPPSLATLQLMDPEDYKEIEAAVQAHVKQKEEERAAAKNGQGGQINSPLISPSVTSLGGPTQS